MKKSILFVAVLLSFTNLVGQQYYMTTPQGYGAGTTGGGNASPTTVTTLSALKSALTSTSAGVILVSGTITVPSGSMMRVVVKNKTIIGLPGAKLVNTTQTATGSGILYLSTGSTNVIMRNLIFEGPGAYDENGNDNFCADGCTKLWVDHCEFQDGMDGNFDLKGNTDNVTVTWCKFTYLKPAKAGGSGGSNDHRFSGLVGSGGSDAPSDGHYNITFQNNYWAMGCKERMPRARNATLHILNCYYNTYLTGTLAIGIGGGNNNSSCYAENSDFTNIASPYRSYNSTDGGTHTINFTGCVKGGTNIGTVAKPSYTYTVMTTADVAAYVPNATCGAGATLKVTASGVMSTSCTVTSASLISIPESNITCYPTLIDNTLNIDFTNAGTGITSIDIYSISGQKVFSQSQNITTDEKVALNLTNLLSGVYICTIKNNEGIKKQKFVKR